MCARIKKYTSSLKKLIAECLSARHLILQYSLAMHVSHALECNYNCGISGTSLTPLASAMCMYCVHVRAHVIKPRAVLPWNIDWPGYKNKGRERETAKKHAMSRPGCISKHQELMRQVSEGQSTMINYGYLA